MKTNLLVFVVTSLIVIIVFEISIRLFAPQNLINNEPIYFQDPVFEKRLIPDSEFVFGTPEYTYSVHTNRDGFRDRNHELEKPVNTKRILFLGDSFTYGPGVAQPDIYPNQVERILNQNINEINCESISMACGGYGPEHYFVLLKNLGIRYQPDVTVLAIFVDNDITDELDAGSPLVPPDRGFFQNGLYAINNFLETRSHAFIFLRARLDFPLWKLGLRPYYFPEVFQKQVPEPLEKDWQRTLKVLESIRDYCDKEDVELIAMLLPAIYQVNQNIWKRYLNVYEINTDEVDLEFPQKRFISFFKEKGIRCIDLLPGFREAAKNKSLYYPIDRHWNEAGHRLCSELIVEYFKKNKILELN